MTQDARRKGLSTAAKPAGSAYLPLKSMRFAYSLARMGSVLGVRLFPDAWAVLVELEYLEPGSAIPTGTAETIDLRMRMLDFCGGFDWFRRFTAPDCQGTHLTGAFVTRPAACMRHDPECRISAGGRGACFRDAFESAVGEAAEAVALCQWRGRGDPLSCGRALSDDPEIVDLCTGDAVDAADFGVAAAGGSAQSAGTAAGPTLEAATTAALFELIERDALALWWHGGQPPLQTPPQLDVALAAAFGPDQDQGRRRWLLDLTTEIGVPVIAALSATPSGEGVVLGAAAGGTAFRAASAAARELAQMELAAAISVKKHKHLGAAALSSDDRIWVSRLGAHRLDCGAPFLPAGPQRGSAIDPVLDLATLLRVLAPHLPRILRAELTDPEIGLAVARLHAPGLASMRSGPSDPRIAEMRARTRYAASGWQDQPRPV